MWFSNNRSDGRPVRSQSPSRKTATLRVESLEARDLFAAEILRDVAPNAGNSNAEGYVRVGNLTYFTANDNTNGVELWITDGTDAGTEMLMDIAPGAPSSSPEELTEFQGKLYFTANDQVHGRELWVTDGTVNGTQLVIDIDNIASSSPDFLTVVGDELMFSAYDPTNGDELWRFDGTTASMVADLRPGSFGSTPDYLTNVNGTLFFSANNADSIGRELWRYDATNGIQLVRNIADLSFESGNPQELIAVGDKLYFTAVGPSDNYFGRELYVSDGTTNGTYMVQDINPGVADSNPMYMADVNGELWFSATTAAAGRELWKSDGTSPNTEIVNDYTPGSGGSNPISIVYQTAGAFVHYDTYNYIVYFPDSGPVEYRGNNLYTGSPLVAGDGYLYFSRANAGFNYEVWQINTTTRAVTLMQEINPSAGSYPSALTYLGGQLYFTANDGTNGAEPWLASFAPVASISGLPVSNTGPEGTEISLSANLTAPGAGGPYTYAWTVTKQGAGSPFATSTSSTFDFTPDDNGTYNVSLTVTDSASQASIAQQALTITNADPVATIVGAPTSVQVGTPINLTGSVTDPGTLDTQTYDWVVMNGSTQVATGTSSTLAFTPTLAGTYEVTFTATDDDAGVGSDTVSITAFEYATTFGAVVIDDPENPGLSNDDLLLINGSNVGADSIIVRQTSSTVATVYIGGRVAGTFPLNSFGRIAIFGHGGNDSIKIEAPISKPSTLYGGTGNDTISGGAGPDMIIGGAGNDWLAGNAGDDVILGGAGSDNIMGGANVDTIVEQGAANITNNRIRVGASNDAYSQIEQFELIGTAAVDSFVLSGVTVNVLIDGKGGADTVAYTNDGNFVLTDTLLTHTAGSVVSTVTMTGISAATLTGGDAANRFTITDWSRTLRINGAAGNDTVVATNDVDFVLTPTSLQRSGLPNVVLNTVENAILTGGVGDNSFTVGAWTGTATLAGAGGADTLLVTDNATTMVLSDTSLTRTGRANITHSGFEAAELTGGAGANTIDGRTFSGELQLSGLGGNDRLASGSGNAIMLGGEGNDILTAGTGPAVLVGGGGNDLLRGSATPTGGTSAGYAIMIGGAGRDTLEGGGGENVLIDSSTDLDASIDGLALLLSHWTAAGTYATRAAQLQIDLSGQLNPDGVPDSLTGSTSALDLFFANLTGPALARDNLSALNQPSAEISVDNA
ncbi:ELWxxDGT repeat protein [Anatilimnocola sp. NA78]|uniref:ELWxxDGT repeat protein n=1 Tax=Anatilimnocola sp. NA78 TaxID=3415683 RepID=UPI003CE4F905